MNENIHLNGIPHIDDEKIMSLTIPIMTAIFPEKILCYKTKKQSSNDMIKINPNKLYRIVTFACESVQFALQPILESTANGMFKTIASESRVGASSRKQSMSPVFVHSAAKLATKLIYRLWQSRDNG